MAITMGEEQNVVSMNLVDFRGTYARIRYNAKR